LARGASGRVVIQLEPELKRRLYSALAMEGLTLKDWFCASAEAYLAKPPVSASAVQAGERK
jgi:hypothetical protein